MKRILKAALTAPKQQSSDDVDMDCSCEILNDTSLSNIGDSDCDCSDCLQANLNAFNEFKFQESNAAGNPSKHTNSKLRESSDDAVPQSRRINKSTNKRPSSQQQINRCKSTSKLVKKNQKSRYRWGEGAQNQEKSDNNLIQFGEGSFSNGQLNEFLLITKHRTRKYLEQNKKIEQSKKKQKEDLKNKIKKNLEFLRYTAQLARAQQNAQKAELSHPYKWNHQKYKCLCNGQKGIKQDKNCCRKKQRNYQGPSYQQIVKQSELKRRNKQIQRKKMEEKCIDNCPNHHNRTSKQKLQKIKKLIQKNVQKYKRQKKKQQELQKEKQKAKEGKLKAIDIKSKEILSRSKKYDDSRSKTSFRLSIEQYDTFSELRQENLRRKQMKENQRDIQNKIKNGGGELLQRVYENIQEDDQLDIKIRMAQTPKQILKTSKQDMPQLRKGEQIYDRISYDAQLKVPAKISKKAKVADPKVEDQQQNYKKTLPKKKQDKKDTYLSRAKQEQQKKKLQLQIQRKKQQIMRQYKKRNSNQPNNSQIRRQYQQKLVKDKNTMKQKPELQDPKKDPYRSNYQTKPNKNTKQIQVHGDPLLQQYAYHDEKSKTKQHGMSAKGDMDVFTSNVHSLAAKSKLHP